LRDSRTVLREAAGEVPAAYSPGSPVYQAANQAYAWLQILLVGPSNPGWNRALAHVEEGPKQEFAACVGTFLRTGPDRIDTPDDYRTLELGKARDRTVGLE
jgi:hypothetical protein